MSTKNTNQKNPDFTVPVSVEGTTPDQYRKTHSSAGTPAIPTKPR